MFKYFKCSHIVYNKIAGPMSVSPDRAKAVDFTISFISDSYTVMIPLKHGSNMWFIIDPLGYEVWLFFILSIPIFLLAMVSSNYIFYGCANLDALSGFVIRNALSEQNCKIPSHTKVFQKIMIMIWIWCMLILVESYSGNLKAMLAKPKLEDPIRTIEDLLSQKEMSWAIEEYSTLYYYLNKSAPGSLMNKLYERAIIMPKTAHWTKMPKGGTAYICPVMFFLTSASKDYTKTGKCNYYITEGKLLNTGRAMGFQVEHRSIVVNFS